MLVWVIPFYWSLVNTSWCHLNVVLQPAMRVLRMLSVSCSRVFRVPLQEVDLEAAVEARKQQVQQLQEEQQQLCVKWEALEQVLQVQNNVLCLMQQLQLADPAAAIAGAEAAEALLAGTTQQDGNTHMHDEDGAKQRSQQQQQNGDTHLPDQEQTDAQGKRPCSPAHNKAASQRRCPPDTAAAAAAAASKAGAKDSKLASSPAPDEHTVEAAVAEAAALLREAAPPPDPSQDQALLLQQARQWLEPVKLYTLRAALMLEQLGMLPANPAAQAALAAAQACPAAVAPGPPLTPVATATVVSAAISAAAAEAQPAAIAKAAAAVAVAVRSAWDGSADGVKGQHEAAIDGVPLVSTRCSSALPFVLVLQRTQLHCQVLHHYCCIAAAC